VLDISEEPDQDGPGADEKIGTRIIVIDLA
jgi:hypothetical protein